MTDPRTDEKAATSLEQFRRFERLNMQICPNCSAGLGAGMCCMTYTEWNCWGCGAHLDSRVVSPRNVMRCDNEWADYERHPGDPIHPLACSCTGRGWYEWDLASRFFFAGGGTA